MPTTQKKLKIVVRVDNDQDTESPFEDDCFTLLSGFNTSEKFMNTFNEFMEDPDRIPGEDFWMLSCYRHGGENWSLMDEGMRCQWDTTKHAGMLYLDNPEERDQWNNVKVGGKEWTSTAAARSVLNTYNRWLSGDCWWYRIDSEKETHVVGSCPHCKSIDVDWYDRHLEQVDSCGGFIGIEHALDEIQHSLAHQFDEKEDADKFDVVIECDDAARCYKDEIEERIKKVGLTLRGDQNE